MRKDRRRKFLLASSALLASPLASIAQPAQQVRRIGFLNPFFPPPPGAPWQFRESLRRAGYEEGKNLVIEARYADGKIERLPQFAEELVRSNVELIVAVLNAASDAARRVTQTIPIVMYANMFPVERGLVASLAHPGSNVTGTVWWAQPHDTFLKMFQIAKESMPSAKRSAHLFDPTDPQSRYYDHRKQDQSLAAIGLIHTRIAMARPEDLETAFAQIKANRIDLLYVSGGGGAIGSRLRALATFAIEQKLVSFSDNPSYLNAGGLLTYGPDGMEVLDRTVSYIDRILRGTRPGDLPVEQSSKYVLALNTKTARAIGFEPSPSFMVRVDRQI